MSTTKHTAGPWNSDISLYLDAAYAAAKGSEQYAWPPKGYADDEITANAHLIAAAPDLLQALEAVVEDFGSHTLSVRTINTMIAAIDKAKGITE